MTVKIPIKCSRCEALPEYRVKFLMGGPEFVCDSCVEDIIKTADTVAQYVKRIDEYYEDFKYYETES